MTKDEAQALIDEIDSMKNTIKTNGAELGKLVEKLKVALYAEDPPYYADHSVWFEDDCGLFSNDSGGGTLEAIDERSAVALFRVWWRNKQRKQVRL